MGGRFLFWDQWGGGGNFDEPAQLSSTLVWVYVSHQPPLAISALTALMAWMLPWRGDSPRRAPPPSRSSPPPPRYILPASIWRLGRGEGRTVLNVWFPLPIFVPGAFVAIRKSGSDCGHACFFSLVKSLHIFLEWRVCHVLFSEFHSLASFCPPFLHWNDMILNTFLFFSNTGNILCFPVLGTICLQLVWIFSFLHLSLPTKKDLIESFAGTKLF